MVEAIWLLYPLNSPSSTTLIGDWAHLASMIYMHCVNCNDSNTNEKAQVKDDNCHDLREVSCVSENN